MKTRKITVELPEDLLREAQRVTKQGITPTLRRGLEILRAQRAYERLLEMRGQVRFSVTLDDLRDDA